METTAQRPQNWPVPSEAQLAGAGFTPEQIARLVDLRTLYPLLEFVESPAAIHRLRFLKWRYRTGHFDD